MTTSVLPATNQELPLGEVEFRVSALYARTDDAHAVFPVDYRDFSDDWSAKIVKAVYTCVEAKKQVNPINIQELGQIPEVQIERRVHEYRAIWQLDMSTYVERIQAEGMRTSALKAHKDSHNALLIAPWREVEQTHSIGTQDVASVQIGGVGGIEDDAGYIWEHATDAPEDEHAPLAMAWPWVSASLKGGMRPGNTHVFAAPPGNRKTSALLSEIHDAVLLRGKKWVHFPFDGGLVRDQIMNLFVIHWVSLLIKHDIPLTCAANAFVDGSITPTLVGSYMYVNSVVAWKLLYNKETGCAFPEGAMDYFSQARQDMAALQAGKGPGLLVMVGPKTVGGDIYKVAQRLRNEQYGRDRPIDGWSLDHVGIPSNRYHDPSQFIPENTRVLHHFTSNEGPPSILLSQISKEGIDHVGDEKDVDPNLRYNSELHANAHAIWSFQYLASAPEVLKMIQMKNRDAPGGPTVIHTLRVEPDTGYVRDDPIWAHRIRLNRPQLKRRKAQQEDYDNG